MLYLYVSVTNEIIKRKKHQLIIVDQEKDFYDYKKLLRVTKVHIISAVIVIGTTITNR
eukprot:UN13924